MKLRRSLICTALLASISVGSGAFAADAPASAPVVHLERGWISRNVLRQADGSLERFAIVHTKAQSQLTRTTSTDNGLTWSTPTILQTLAEPIAAGGQVALATRNGEIQLFFSVK